MEIGDWVRCVEPYDAALEKGTLYEVCDVSTPTRTIRVKSVSEWWAWARFEPAGRPKVGDYVQILGCKSWDNFDTYAGRIARVVQSNPTSLEAEGITISDGRLWNILNSWRYVSVNELVKVNSTGEIVKIVKVENVKYYIDEKQFYLKSDITPLALSTEEHSHSKIPEIYKIGTQVVVNGCTGCRPEKIAYRGHKGVIEKFTAYDIKVSGCPIDFSWYELEVIGACSCATSALTKQIAELKEECAVERGKTSYLLMDRDGYKNQYQTLLATYTKLLGEHGLLEEQIARVKAPVVKGPGILARTGTAIRAKWLGSFIGYCFSEGWLNGIIAVGFVSLIGLAISGLVIGPLWAVSHYHLCDKYVSAADAVPMAPKPPTLDDPRERAYWKSLGR